MNSDHLPNPVDREAPGGRLAAPAHASLLPADDRRTRGAILMDATDDHRASRPALPPHEGTHQRPSSSEARSVPQVSPEDVNFQKQVLIYGSS